MAESLMRPTGVFLIESDPVGQSGLGVDGRAYGLAGRDRFRRAATGRERQSQKAYIYPSQHPAILAGKL